MDLRFALLLVCFFVSGFAALLYQTAWTREFAFLFGTSELAVVAVLAAYMGGLALGAATAARFVGRLTRPVLAYGILELGIAICALGVPLGIGIVQSLYLSIAGLPRMITSIICSSSCPQSKLHRKFILLYSIMVEAISAVAVMRTL